MAIYLNDHMIGINSHTTTIQNINTNITVEPLTITSNGTYNTPGKAYSPVIVDGISVKPIVLRPDVDLTNPVREYSGDYKLVTGAGITIPAYTTSSTTIQSATELERNIVLDYDNYNYYVVQRTLLIPEYNISTLGKGRIEYEFASSISEIIPIAANTYSSIDGTVKYTSRTIPITNHAFYCNVYWASATTIGAYQSSSYGLIAIPATPSLSSEKLIIKAPQVNFRGNATYFTQTYFEALTDARVQYIIKVYKAPRTNLATNGWEQMQQISSILNCINNNNCHLT